MTRLYPNPLDESFMSGVFTTRDESSRCARALTKLASQSNGPLLVTGRLAVAWHLSGRGINIGMRPFNDIDIVIKDESRLRASLTQHFLVAHYHPSHRRGRMLLQLADEETRARIDLFTPASDSLAERSLTARLGEGRVHVVAAEDLAARLLCVLCQVLAGRTVAPKYYEAFTLLAGVADLDLASTLWPEYRDDWHADDLRDAITRVREAVAQNPALLQPEVYGQADRQACPRCRESEAFPLAPPSKLYEVWGYA